MNIGVDFEKLVEKATIVTEQYSRTPNFVIDDMYMAQLNDKAFKCYMFILRQTVGFNRSSTSIATETFKKYCGIKKNNTVYTCIQQLEQLITTFHQVIYFEQTHFVAHTESEISTCIINQKFRTFNIPYCKGCFGRHHSRIVYNIGGQILN